MRDALSIFDRVVSFSGSNLTRKAVTENLNVLDYDTYFEATDLILEHKIPNLLLLFNKTLSLGFDGHHFISGLASHFRDLMVCQHPDTITLLEVGEEAQQLYREQSKRTSPSFLLQGLNIANDCDLKYKTSKNQRLLVELTLMKLASIDFDGEKKNPESVALQNKTIDFIAPSAFYKQIPKVANSSNQTIEKPVENNNTETVSTKAEPAKDSISSETKIASTTDHTRTEETNVVSNPQVKLEEKKPEPLNTPETNDIRDDKKIKINRPTKRVSGLSIKSLNAKKQHELNRIEVVIDEKNLPRENFTEEDLRKHWADFIEIIDKKGQKILASNLHTDVPKLKEDFKIHIELPNSTMKKEIEREQFELMEYLRAKLNNHFVHLDITVNETTAKKFAFTPEEKYEKLREKNPVIDLLRQEFDLDL